MEFWNPYGSITTFITRKGLFRYTRLMFGIACAPKIFQKVMEQILAGCEGCLNYMDDIIIYGETMEQLNVIVAKVLRVLKEYNVMLNHGKFIFGEKELEFIGHKLSAEGIKPTHDSLKRKSLSRLPPANMLRRSTQFSRSCKFVPNLATLTEPLRRLTRKNTTFAWNEEQQISFEKLKEFST